MTLRDAPPFKHVGSFCIIFFLAVFRPAAIWPEVPVSTAPLAVLAAWLLLFFKIHKTVGYRTFFAQHKTLVLLIAAYFMLCGVSLIANHHRYPNIVSFIRWGLTFPIIQSALVACGFLFTLPQNEKGPSLTRAPASGLFVLAIAAVVPAMTLWQTLDNQNAYHFYQYTVSGDIGNIEYLKRSILATSTDLGAVSAILSIAALMGATERFQKREWLWGLAALLLFSLNVTSGVLSGSRGFFLSMGVGVFTLLALWLRTHLKLMLLAVVALANISILMAQFGPTNLLVKLAKLTPLFHSMHIGLPFDRRDLSLNLTTEALLGNRKDLWLRALDNVIAHPWTGISNGGYRLLNESVGDTPINNAHNAFLQLSVDAGIGGLLLGLVAVGLFVKRHQRKTLLAILMAAFTGLLVDNFTDHSLAWIVITTFALANSAAPQLNEISSPVKTKLIGASLFGLAILSAVGITAKYQIQQHEYAARGLADQIYLASTFYSNDYWNDPPILISENLSKVLGEARDVGTLSLYGEVPSENACAYAYYGAKLLHLPDEKLRPQFQEARGMGNQWAITNLEGHRCAADSRDPTNLKHWTSNHYQHFSTSGSKKNGTQLRMVNDNLALFSPIFDAHYQQTVRIWTRGTALEHIDPTLQVTYFDAASNRIMTEQIFEIKSETVQILMPLLSVKSGKAYLRLRLRDWQQNQATKQEQEVIVKGIEILPSLSN